MNSKATIQIDNWKLVGFCKRDYMAPEQIEMVLIGFAENHPIKGRNPVQTSEVIWFSHTSGIAETKNTIYALGQPDPDWLVWMAHRGFTLEDYAIEKAA